MARHFLDVKSAAARRPSGDLHGAEVFPPDKRC
jgi:hypothetical protein